MAVAGNRPRGLTAHGTCVPPDRTVQRIPAFISDIAFHGRRKAVTAGRPQCDVLRPRAQSELTERSVEFRSIADLATTVRSNLNRVPVGVDLIVGVPRSGVLAASVIALGLNRRLTDLNLWLSGASTEYGRTRSIPGGGPPDPRDARSILLVDDSVRTGKSIEAARSAILRSGFSGRLTTLAIFAAPSGRGKVDLHFEVVSLPRAFEWNVMHRVELADCCVDIDGVLCVDPTDEENDDGQRYQRFLHDAAPLVIPTYPVGHVVTSRLERYRPQTEAWLRRQGVSYGSLHMLDAPDAEARRRNRMHAGFKASVYRGQHETHLFIESDSRQSAQIADIAGKPVLCYATQRLHKPGASVARIEAAGAGLATRLSRLLVRARRRAGFS